MSRLVRYGGIAASIMLIAVGVGSMYAGIGGRHQVRTQLAREQIVGTPDSTIPGQKVDTGSEAQAFANVMRKHTLEATGGLPYAKMDHYVAAKGGTTGDEALAAKDPKSGKAVENPMRNIWVTETALTTALNTAFFAESISTFVIVAGLALLLAGIGFLILTVRLLGPRSAVRTAKAPTARTTSVPAA